MLLTWQLHCGDAAKVLDTLADLSVQCVVTSPPYWGLRDYGTGQWLGGDQDCDHMPEKRGGRFSTPVSAKQASNAGSGSASSRDCGCGAVRVDSQIGMESTPDAYVAALVSVFREMRRVLADDGVCWLNLGDSYATGAGRVGNCPGGGDQGDRWSGPSTQPNRLPIAGLKAKDLVGIPWRVAFALQADGWYLRSDVIWAKPNPMPESVTDRPTKAHEYVFLLTKSERYTYNADAIRLPVSEAMLEQMAQGYDGMGLKDYDGAGVQNPSEVKRRIIDKARYRAANIPGQSAHGYTKRLDGTVRTTQGANARTVWQIATEASLYEHFAVMPKALARKCILAACPIGGVVLDPFAGVCTTGVVALEEGRSFVGIELNPIYHEIGRNRLANTMPLLADEVTSDAARPACSRND